MALCDKRVSCTNTAVMIYRHKDNVSWSQPYLRCLFLLLYHCVPFPIYYPMKEKPQIILKSLLTNVSPPPFPVLFTISSAKCLHPTKEHDGLAAGGIHLHHYECVTGVTTRTFVRNTYSLIITGKWRCVAFTCDFSMCLCYSILKTIIEVPSMAVSNISLMCVSGDLTLESSCAKYNLFLDLRSWHI